MIAVLKHALMITSFVLIMMLLIEYINVQTRGAWQQALRKSRAGQGSSFFARHWARHPGASVPLPSYPVKTFQVQWRTSKLPLQSDRPEAFRWPSSGR